MFQRFSRRTHRFCLLALFCGTLLQTTCASIATDAITGVATSVTEQLIRQSVYRLFGVSSTSSLGI